MRIFLLNLLIFLGLLSSCTIQKRLYRPGWEISFKGNWKKNQALQTSDELYVLVEQDTLEELVALDPNKELLTHEDLSREHDQHESPFSTNLDQQERSITSVSKKIDFTKSKIAFKSILPEKKLEPNNPSPVINLVGLIFLIIGLIILAIGLLIYIPALSSSTAFFSTLFGILVVALGGVISIVGLIILLVGLMTDAVIKNEERLEKQKEITTATEEKVEPETQNPQTLEPIPNVDNQEKETSKSKSWLIIGGCIAAFSIIYLIISNK